MALALILTFGPVMMHPGVIDGIKVRIWSLHDVVFVCLKHFPCFDVDGQLEQCCIQ